MKNFFLALGLAVICGLLLSGCGSPSASSFILDGTIPVQAPENIQAGEPATITLGPVVAPNGTPVTLMVNGTYGARFYQSAFSSSKGLPPLVKKIGEKLHFAKIDDSSDGKATFTLPAEATWQAGYVTLLAISGQAQGEATMNIQSGPPVDPLVPLVGSRQIPADGAHWSMVVSVPFDQYGNPVVNGTPVKVRALHPDNRLEEKDIEVQHLLAWTKLFSGTKAGRTTITLNSGKAYGPESSLQEAAGWPTSFTISATPESLPADGRQLSTIRTSLLKDRFGNIVPDGTLVTFVVETPDGLRRSIPGYSVDGYVQTTLQSPREPGTLAIYGELYGVESEKLALAYTPGPAVDQFALTVKKDSTKRVVTIEAGPILGSLQQFVPDGTPVIFQVSDASGQKQTLTSPAINGRTTLELRLATLFPGSYLVEAKAGAGAGSAKFSVP